MNIKKPEVYSHLGLSISELYLFWKKTFILSRAKIRAAPMLKNRGLKVDRVMAACGTSRVVGPMKIA